MDSVYTNDRDSQDYDLIVDNGEKLSKVQVKTSRFRSKQGVYQVSLKTCGGNRSGQTIKNFDKNSSDLVFVLLDNEDTYLIPREAIRGNTCINLGINMAMYKVAL